MAALVEGIERVAPVRQLLASPGGAAAVLGGAVRHAHDGARCAIRQPCLPEDLDAAGGVEMTGAVFHGAAPYRRSLDSLCIGIGGMGWLRRTWPSVTAALVASAVQPSLSTSTTRTRAGRRTRKLACET